MLTKKHTEDSNRKDRAVAYVRVSSKKQAEEGVSAATHLWSRPAGRKIREVIYEQRVGHIIVLKMDRLFRDVQDCLSTVDELAGVDVETLRPNRFEQDKIDYMRHRLYIQNWSENKIAKNMNEINVKGKMDGTWSSSSVLRTCRYHFHENRNMFTAPPWWEKEPYHDSVSF